MVDRIIELSDLKLGFVEVCQFLVIEYNHEINSALGWSKFADFNVGDIKSQDIIGFKIE